MRTQPAQGLDVDEHAGTFAALFRGRAVGVARGTGQRVLEANGELMRILGLDEAALSAGVSWREVVAPEYFERGAEAVARARREGSASVIGEVVCRDGSRAPVFVVVVITSVEPSRWVSLVVDLSREEQLARLALAEAAIVSTLLDDAPVGFAFLDTDLRFVRVNHELAAMNGLSVEAHRDQLVFDLLPQLKEVAEDLMLGVLRTGQAVRDVAIVGQTDADPGVEHSWSESFFPVRAPGGPLLGIAAIARDETRERQLQERLTQTLEHQHAALRSMQASLLPVRLPQVPGFDLASAYRPASQDVDLGGDWFDAVLAPDGRLFLAVGDTVGHGVAAIGGMARASAAARAFISEGHAPAVVLSRLHDLLWDSEPRVMASAVVLAVDPTSGTVEYASAGHLAPVLVELDSRASLLRVPPGMLLGVVEEPAVPFASTHTVLAPGSALILFTDGLVERRGASMTVGLDHLLSKTRLTAQSTAHSLVDAAFDWAPPGLDGASDDVCVLVVRRDMR